MGESLNRVLCFGSDKTCLSSRSQKGTLKYSPHQLITIERHSFTQPTIQSPLAAVTVPVNCFSTLFDYKVSSEWLVYMAQSCSSSSSPTLHTGQRSQHILCIDLNIQGQLLKMQVSSSIYIYHHHI